jgi:transposase
MDGYPMPAVERAMKVQQVILKAMSGELQWWQAAEILGISCRSMRRWKQRYQQHGYDGLFDRRRRRPRARGNKNLRALRVLRGSRKNPNRTLSPTKH